MTQPSNQTKTFSYAINTGYAGFISERLVNAYQIVVSKGSPTGFGGLNVSVPAFSGLSIFGITGVTAAKIRENRRIAIRQEIDRRILSGESVPSPDQRGYVAWVFPLSIEPLAADAGWRVTVLGLKDCSVTGLIVEVLLIGDLWKAVMDEMTRLIALEKNWMSEYQFHGGVIPLESMAVSSCPHETKEANSS